MNEITNRLQSLPFYNKLSESEKQLLESASTIRSYKKGQIIYSGDNDCLGHILLLEGELRTYIISEEGREITLFNLLPDSTSVLTASCVISEITFDTQTVVEKDSRLLVINSGSFEKIVNQNIYVKCYVYELLTQRFSSVMWTLQQIIFLGFDRRLASFLISEYERTDSKEIKMTQEQIAAGTSSAREVVARMLKRFSAEGLVTVKRGSVTIEDIDSLRLMV